MKAVTYSFCTSFSTYLLEVYLTRYHLRLTSGIAGAICGSPGSTMITRSTDDLGSIQNCSTILGSLFVAVPGDALELPETLQTVTGAVVCNASELVSSPYSIKATGLRTVLASPNETSAVSRSGMVISDYSVLKSLYFPSLRTIGSNFVLTGNPDLRNINGFDSIAEINGNLTIIGNFTSLYLPSLIAVGGNVDIESSADGFVWPVMRLQSSVESHRGKFVCNVQLGEPTQSAQGPMTAIVSSSNRATSGFNSSPSNPDTSGTCSNIFNPGNCLWGNADEKFFRHVS